MDLTSRQREILDFVKEFTLESGYPPSVREIGRHFHIYPRAAFDHLKALERKGYLRRRQTTSRGIEILDFTERRSGISIREVPVLGRVAAGKPTLAVENIEDVVPLARDWAEGEEVFLLQVKGESMSPYILPGDYVLVRCQSSADNGDVVVALIDDEATVKRFFLKGDEVILKPDNEAWEAVTVREGDRGFQILGRVIGIFRRV
ncbi:MAG: repressor LexA [Deltaproteobacteria bacterium]|nr:repressor LexA [Deltaproteobacteria bacterium]